MQEQSSNYQPQMGDDVVIYINKFKPEKFEEGKRMVTEEFPNALSNSGETMFSYFYVNEEECEAGAIQFFKKGNNVEDWHSNQERLELLERLNPTLQEPLTMYRFKLNKTLSCN